MRSEGRCSSISLGNLGDIEAVRGAAGPLGHLVPGPERAPGMCVELAVSLGLVPRDVQGPLKGLGTASCLEATRVRSGRARLHPSSATTWWLALESVTSPEGVIEEEFMQQVEAVVKIAQSSRSRLTAAWNEQKRLRATQAAP